MNLINKTSRKYLYKNLLLVTLFMMSISPFLSSKQIENTNPFDNSQNYLSSFPLQDGENSSNPISSSHPPSLSLQSFQSPNISILFIVNDSTSLDPNLDQSFYDYLKDLNYSVTLHDANDSYNYTNFDAILISDSIDLIPNPGWSVDSLVSATIPILTMEKETWNVFQLGNGAGVSTVDGKFLDILDNSSYITNHLPLGSLNASDPTADKGYITGFNAVPIGSNVTGLIRPTLAYNPEKFYRSLVILEKGGKNWILSSSPERRVFLGTSNGSSLNDEGWKLWNRTLNWVLYDDKMGDARINVNVLDANNKSITNVEVNLVNSTVNILQTTDSEGIATFYGNISWGLYNLTAKYGNKTETLINRKIVPRRTYHLIEEFNFTIQLPFYSDNKSPFFYDIEFDKSESNGTFYVNVLDESEITLVNLSLIATNLTDENILISNNFTMVNQSPVLIGELNTYFNDTALDTLSNDINISIQYFILARDNANNENKTKSITFLLSDPDPPIIHEYNVTDYGDGTLEFYANITDESGVHDPVILHINGTPAEMHLNGSGFWTYRTQAYYGDFLNYTIFSANDTVGNPSPVMEYHNITVSDSISPTITFLPGITRDEGFTEWNIKIEESPYQSGLDSSNVNITLSINSELNEPELMFDIGGGYFYYFYTFNFNDSVEFWINAIDFAGNLNIEYGYFTITDNSSPQVSFNAYEFGNGTIEFYANVIDWPNNITTVYVYENSSGIWQSYLLDQIEDSNQYSVLISDFSYQSREVLYYVAAEDNADNRFEPNPDQYKLIILTDIVPPDVYIEIENSKTIDGQITIKASAIDTYGGSQVVLNPFYANITYQSVTVTYEMELDFPIYNLTHSFVFGDEVSITVWTSDDAGNKGTSSKTIIVDDAASPKIEDWDVIEFQNGTVSIWAEISEGQNGSGLGDDSDSLKIEYIYITKNSIPMKSNGTMNFYYATIPHVFEPGNVFTFQILVSDNNNNSNKTDWEPYAVPDLSPPIYYPPKLNQNHINHTSCEIEFWVNATDPFGKISTVTITINYSNIPQWINKTYTMEQFNHSHYVYISYITCNITFEYYIQIYDEWMNVNTTSIIKIKSKEFLSSYADDYGFYYNSDRSGNVTFWIKVIDPFDDHYALLSLYNKDTKELWLSPTRMNFNISHTYYEVNFQEIYTLSYFITLFDSGVDGGYYNPIVYNDTLNLFDNWSPSINNAGISRLTENTLVIWANITDWGTPPTELQVYLYYDLIPSGGGSGASTEKVQMNYNGSLFIYTLTLDKTGTLEWYIEALDPNDSTSSKIERQEEPFSYIQNGLFDLSQIIITVGSTITVLSLLFIGVIAYQRRKRAIYKKAIDIQEKLSVVSNIYTILVTTEAGIPIFNMTNALYKKDESLDLTLSGLSVGMSDFLETFQSQFTEQMQDQEGLLGDESLRMSVIEQHKVKILIAATRSFRIFVFMNEKPNEFTREIFFNIASNLENKLMLEDLGFVDEHLVEPHVVEIVDSSIPLTLFQKFTIDPFQLRHIEYQILKGKSSFFISKAAIEALKRLFIVQNSPLHSIKDIQAEVKAFDEILTRGMERSLGGLLYNDARRILISLLKISPAIVFEALWEGSSPDLKIIVPIG